MLFLTSFLWNRTLAARVFLDPDRIVLPSVLRIAQWHGKRHLLPQATQSTASPILVTHRSVPGKLLDRSLPRPLCKSSHEMATLPRLLLAGVVGTNL
jgi:hypothetical protein